MTIFHTLLTATALAMTCAACSASAQSDATELRFDDNAIQPGSASITVNLTGCNHPDNVTMQVAWTPLLDNIAADHIWAEREPYTLTHQDGAWSGEVPMELLKKNYIPLYIKESGHPVATLLVGLDQNTPLTLDAEYTTDGITVKRHTGGTGLVDSSGKMGHILDAGGAGLGSKEIYEDCFKFRAWEIDSLIPYNIEQTLKGLELQPAERQWLTNEVTRRRFAGRLLCYEEIARTFGLDFVAADTTKIQAPPTEYYSFLNSLDYSPMLLDEMLPDLRIFTNRLLDRLQIAPIADTPVAEWQADASAKLSAVIDSVTPTLLDLLTITSYLNQIQDSGRLLSTSQKANVSSHYGDGSGAGALILSRNENPYPTVSYIHEFGRAASELRESDE